MQKWEYIIIKAIWDTDSKDFLVQGLHQNGTFKKFNSPLSIDTCMNQVGNVGWELVGDSSGEDILRWKYFYLFINPPEFLGKNNFNMKIGGTEYNGIDKIIEYLNESMNRVQICGIFPNTSLNGNIFQFLVLFSRPIIEKWRRLSFKRPLVSAEE